MVTSRGGRLSLFDLKIKALFVGLLIIIPLSCSTGRSRVESDQNAPQWTRRGDIPRVVAVLPFKNETPAKDIGIWVRESFYSHLSALNYYDLELGRVDNTLKTIERTSAKKWRDLSPAVLGDILHADLIIYGKVRAFKKYFLGVYSQIALEVEIEMVEAKSGEGRWRKTLIKRSHAGGIPFSLFGVAPAAFRSGWHMKKEKAIALVDRLSRALVAEIPNPSSPPVSPTIIEIQVASFLDRGRAEKILQDFQGQDLRPRIKEVTLGADLWHRIILGPFYSKSEAEQAKERIQQSTTFKPIVIRRYPETEGKDSSEK